MRHALLRKASAVCALAIGLAACGGSGRGGAEVTYDAQQVTQALENKVIIGGAAASIQSGDPPSPNSQSITTDAPNADVLATVGARASFTVTVTSDVDLSRLFAKVPGAADYFEANLNEGKAQSVLSKTRQSTFRAVSAAKSGTSAPAQAGKSQRVVSFEVDVPSNLQPGGRLCFEVSAQNVSNQVSNKDLACLAVRAAAVSTPAPTPGANTAAACLNPVLFAVGSSVQQTFREASSSGNSTFDDSYVVTRETTFNGNAAVELDFGGGDFEYFRVDSANQRLLFFGSEFRSGETTETEGFNPPLEIPYGLTPGQSRTVNFTATYSDGSFTEQITGTSTITYAGRERISVPAGSFDSCRFNETVTLNGFTDSVSYWFAVGSGVEVRFSFGSFTDELVSASINGQPVTGN